MKGTWKTDMRWARENLSALIYSEGALGFAGDVGAFGGLLSSPYSPIPHLHRISFSKVLNVFRNFPPNDLSNAFNHFSI